MKRDQDIDAARNDLIKKLLEPDISKQQIDDASQAISANNVPAAPQESVEGFASIKEVCSFIGISRVTAWRLCKDQRLVSYTIGRRRLFRLSEVARAISSGIQA